MLVLMQGSLALPFGKAKNRRENPETSNGTKIRLGKIDRVREETYHTKIIDDWIRHLIHISTGSQIISGDEASQSIKNR
jgi:hypothetical protein